MRYTHTCSHTCCETPLCSLLKGNTLLKGNAPGVQLEWRLQIFVFGKITPGSSVEGKVWKMVFSSCIFLFDDLLIFYYCLMVLFTARCNRGQNWIGQKYHVSCSVENAGAAWRTHRDRRSWHFNNRLDSTQVQVKLSVIPKNVVALLPCFPLPLSPLSPPLTHTHLFFSLNSRSKLSIIPQTPTLFIGTIRSNLDPFHESSDEMLWLALEQVQMKAYVSSLTGGLEVS